MTIVKMYKVVDEQIHSLSVYTDDTKKHIVPLVSPRPIEELSVLKRLAEQYFQSAKEYEATFDLANITTEVDHRHLQSIARKASPSIMNGDMPAICGHSPEDSTPLEMNEDAKSYCTPSYFKRGTKVQRGHLYRVWMAIPVNGISERHLKEDAHMDITTARKALSVLRAEGLVDKVGNGPNLKYMKVPQKPPAAEGLRNDDGGIPVFENNPEGPGKYMRQNERIIRDAL